MEDFIVRAWLLSGLMPEEASSLAKRASKMALNRGIVLVEAGKSNDSLWIIMSGRVGIFAGAGDSQKQVAELSEGDLLGEMSWLDGHPASASAAVLDNGTEVLRIPFREFEKFLGEFPEAHIQILRKFAINLSHRLRG